MTKKEAYLRLFKRYRGKIAQNPDKFYHLPHGCQTRELINLCDEAINNFSKRPVSIMTMWIGYLQGVLAAVEIVDIDVEIEYTNNLVNRVFANKVKSFRG